MHTAQEGKKNIGYSTFPSDSSKLGLVSRELIHSPAPPTRCWTTVPTENSIATWGAPRIHGELLKLGFQVSEPTVSRWLRIGDFTS